MQKFIVYSKTDEIFITTPEAEQEFLKEWFYPDSGRNQKDFNRNVINSTAIGTRSRLSIRY